MGDQRSLEPGARVRVVLQGSRYYGREGIFERVERLERRRWWGVRLDGGARPARFVRLLRDDLEPLDD